MRAKLLTDGRYYFMKDVAYPLEVECQLSPSGNVAVTPEQLKAAGVTDVPDRFCCKVWYWTTPTEAEFIEEE